MTLTASQTDEIKQDLEPKRALSQARAIDYVLLLKPRVMSLVVFTGLTGYVVAGAGLHPFLATVAIFCIAIGAGAAGALNMAFEGETDALMRRTRGRPVAMGRISKADALAFGTILSVFSVMIMGLAVNLLAAFLLCLTILYYVFFYTLFLKRRSPQNIVIGGAAGAFPPVIGWAIATNHAPLAAWALFAIIFLWTPPHSWALALYASDDYKRAGIPMMPVAKGASHTRLLIFLYSLILVPVSFTPLLFGLGSFLYFGVALVSGAIFLYFAAVLFRSKAGEEQESLEAGLYQVKPSTKPARNLFIYSIFYLALLFFALLIEAIFRNIGS